MKTLVIRPLRIKMFAVVLLFSGSAFSQSNADSLKKDEPALRMNNSVDTLNHLRVAPPVRMDTLKPAAERLPAAPAQEPMPQTSAFTNVKIHTPVISIDLIMDLYDKDIDFDIQYEGTAASGNTGIGKKKPTESDVAKLISAANPLAAMQTQADSGKLKEPKKDQLPYTAQDANYNKALVYINNAQKLFSGQRYVNALKEINRAIESAPNVAMAYAVKGSILYMLKENDDAKQSWERALELDPTLDNVRALLLRMY